MLHICKYGASGLVPEQQLQLSVQEPLQRPATHHLSVAVSEDGAGLAGSVPLHTLGAGGQGDDPGRAQVQAWSRRGRGGQPMMINERRK